jgi:cytochrome b
VVFATGVAAGSVGVAEAVGAGASAEGTRVRVWDLPTRVFHWSLAALVVASIMTAKVGGNAMEWHFRSGYAILALLLFRLVWGIVGGRWSRFVHFVYAPAASLRYLRGQSRPDEHHDVGHSPLGALSVFALLAVLVAQVATGLVADDEIASAGPLVRFVSGATSAWSTGWHKNAGQWTVVGLVALHVVAIVAYALRRRNLVGPMLVGDKLLGADVPPSVDTAGSRLVALAIAAVCAAVAAGIASLRV